MNYDELSIILGYSGFGIVVFMYYTGSGYVPRNAYQRRKCVRIQKDRPFHILKLEKSMIQSIEMSDRAFAYQWTRTLLITLVKTNEQHVFPSQETLDALLSNDDEAWIQGFADGYSYTILSDFSWISFSPFLAREETLEGQYYDDGWNTGFACACHDKISLLCLEGKEPPIVREMGRAAASSAARSSATPPSPTASSPAPTISEPPP